MTGIDNALIQNKKLQEMMLKRVAQPKPIIPISKDLTAIHIPIIQLIHFENNLNQMEPDKFDALKESIKQMGILEPLLVNKRGENQYVVLDGNHRLDAGIELQMDTLPCKIMEISAEKELQYNIHFNEFRGELQINLVSSAVSEMIKSGLSITTIAERLNLPESRVLGYADFSTMPEEYIKELQDSMLKKFMILPTTLPTPIVNKILNEINIQSKSRFNYQLYYRDLGMIMGRLFTLYVENHMQTLKNPATKTLKNICECGHPLGLHKELDDKDFNFKIQKCSECECKTPKQKDKIIYPVNVVALNEIMKKTIDEYTYNISLEKEIIRTRYKDDLKNNLTNFFKNKSNISLEDGINAINKIIDESLKE